MLNNRGFLNVDLMIALLIFSCIVALLSQSYSISIAAVNGFYTVSNALGEFEEFIIELDYDQFNLNQPIIHQEDYYKYEISLLKDEKEYYILDCKLYRQGELFEEFKKVRRK